MKKTTSIALRGLELPILLGWTEEERSKKQIIILDLDIHFVIPPKACATDQLEDTDCYDSLINHIKNAVSARSFRLIEHLAQEIFHLIKQFLQNDNSVSLQITKKPPIANLMGGVTFIYGDPVLL